MQVYKVFTAVIVAAALSVGMANARTLRNAAAPASFPPSSFKGKQFVDSKGCVYIRSGFTGAVNWVPRVTRSRKHVCGQNPTFAKRAAPKPVAPKVAARKPAVVAAAKPRVQATPKRVVRRVARKPVPASKPTIYSNAQPKAAAPAPKRVVRRVVRKPAPAPAPKRVVRRVVQKPAPAPAPKKVVRRVVRQQPASCPGRSRISAMHTSQGSGVAVRCGPQTQDPTGGAVFANATPRAQVQKIPRVQQRRLVAPRPTRAQVIQTRRPTQPAKTIRVITSKGDAVIVRHPHKPKVPAGYRSAWKDDRLNPGRARGTASGQDQMQMVWTNTVPRRLVAVSISQDTRRRVVVRKQRDLPAVQGVIPAGQSRVSAKTSPTVRRRTAVTSQRYVQVGTYGNAANVQKATRRLQGMGMPVRISKIKSQGRILQIVMAGPFANQAQLKSALSAARRAGYRDAVLRK